MSEASSRGSAGSTSDSNEPGCGSDGNAKRMSGDAASSPITGPESNAAPTFELWHENIDGRMYQADEAAWTLMSEPQKAEPFLLISSAADSPAKTSASPASELDSTPEPARASSSSAPESLTLFSPLEDGSSLRTFPDYFPANADEISLSYSRRWPASGFTTSPGECWTADTSESPNDAAGSTSLRDVLEEAVPARYFLSQRAAAGILRRAEKRGRELPAHLESALRSVATPAEPDNSTTRTTS